MFSSIQTFFIALGGICTLLFIFFCLRSLLFPKQQYIARRPITTFESRMFFRLKAAFPQHHILAQVAFSALITSDNYKIRRLFNRKVTDFVILNHELEVIAIIELDDPSHFHKVEEDRLRDQMFHEAGYRVYRYTNIPDLRQLQKDIL